MTWPYIRHVDGLISVTLDNNAWDFLHERGIDLAREFPKDRFALFITHQVEIETNAIPLAKDTLHAYIQHSMRTANIQVARTVGFYTEDNLQRHAPLSQGTFQTPLEAEIYDALFHYLREKPRPNGLHTNEGDISVAVASFSSIVLTMERPSARGPLKFAHQHGGKILFLQDIPGAATNLSQHVTSYYAQI